MGLIVLFTHLKIILLQYFQFSAFSDVQMDPKYAFGSELKVNLLYYLIYFCYYLLASLHFLVIFMVFTILFMGSIALFTVLFMIWQLNKSIIYVWN